MGTWLAWKYNADTMKRYAELCGPVKVRKIGDPPDDPDAETSEEPGS
jgi:hypothetical protein